MTSTPPSPTHSLRQISPHVFWLPSDPRTDRPILGVVSGNDGSLLVDAGNSPAHARLFLGEIENHHLAPPRFLALTHWHWDHVFGAHTLNLPTFASLENRRIMLDMARLDWSDAALDRRVAEGKEIAFCRDNILAEMPNRRDLVIRPPDIAFSGQVELDLGGLTCQIVHVGGDHSADSCVVAIPSERVMFIGDCLCEDLYCYPHRYTTRRLIPLFDRLLSYEVDFYLEGHAPEPIPRRQMEADRALYQWIGSRVDQIGPQREAVLFALQSERGQPLTPDEVEIADAFLAGLDAA